MKRTLQCLALLAAVLVIFQRLRHQYPADRQNHSQGQAGHDDSAAPS
jgi:hypothetical protein